MFKVFTCLLAIKVICYSRKLLSEAIILSTANIKHTVVINVQEFIYNARFALLHMKKVSFLNLKKN